MHPEFPIEFVMLIIKSAKTAHNWCSLYYKSKSQNFELELVKLSTTFSQMIDVHTRNAVNMFSIMNRLLFLQNWVAIKF